MPDEAIEKLIPKLTFLLFALVLFFGVIFNIDIRPKIDAILEGK